MTSKAAVVLAISLMINGVHLIFDEDILNNKHSTAVLVFLLTTCLVVKEFVVFPNILWRNSFIICTALELPLSMLLLESSLYYIWRFIQDYVVLRSDDILVHLSEERGLDWLVCHLCCGKNNCSDLFAELMLKGISFCMLLGVCCIV